MGLKIPDQVGNDADGIESQVGNDADGIKSQVGNDADVIAGVDRQSISGKTRPPLRFQHHENLV